MSAQDKRAVPSQGRCRYRTTPPTSVSTKPNTAKKAAYTSCLWRLRRYSVFHLVGAHIVFEGDLCVASYELDKFEGWTLQDGVMKNNVPVKIAFLLSDRASLATYAFKTNVLPPSRLIYMKYTFRPAQRVPWSTRRFGCVLYSERSDNMSVNSKVKKVVSPPLTYLSPVDLSF